MIIHAPNVDALSPRQLTAASDSEASSKIRPMSSHSYAVTPRKKYQLLKQKMINRSEQIPNPEPLVHLKQSTLKEFGLTANEVRIILPRHKVNFVQQNKTIVKTYAKSDAANKPT